MKSLWNEDYNFKKRNSLPGDIEADVVIIGAGITGLLIGYMLKKEVIEPIIIEADRIAGGNTKNTTAKITSQHGLIYDTLIKEFGEDGAREYAKANELAIKKFKEIIEDEKIDCDFEEKSAYI